MRGIGAWRASRASRCRSVDAHQPGISGPACIPGACRPRSGVASRRRPSSSIVSEPRRSAGAAVRHVDPVTQAEQPAGRPSGEGQVLLRFEIALSPCPTASCRTSRRASPVRRAILARRGRHRAQIDQRCRAPLDLPFQFAGSREHRRDAAAGAVRAEFPCESPSPTTTETLSRNRGHLVARRPSGRHDLHRLPDTEGRQAMIGRRARVLRAPWHRRSGPEPMVWRRDRPSRAGSELCRARGCRRGALGQRAPCPPDDRPYPPAAAEPDRRLRAFRRHAHSRRLPGPRAARNPASCQRGALDPGRVEHHRPTLLIEEQFRRSSIQSQRLADDPLDPLPADALERTVVRDGGTFGAPLQAVGSLPR